MYVHTGCDCTHRMHVHACVVTSFRSRIKSIFLCRNVLQYNLYTIGFNVHARMYLPLFGESSSRGSAAKYSKLNEGIVKVARMRDTKRGFVLTAREREGNCCSERGKFGK
jgi:hypothetical protein